MRRAHSEYCEAQVSAHGRDIASADFFAMRIVTNLCHGSHHHFASKTEKLKSARTPAKLAEQVERTKPNTLATFFFQTDDATQS